MNKDHENDTKMTLDGDRSLTITRTFNASAKIVFEAYTQAKHVKRWWAPSTRGEIVSVEADVRVGGAYRYVMKARGNTVAFSGKYTEVTPYTRVVYTQYFEAMMEAGFVVATVTFTEKNGRTKMTSHEVYPSVDAFQGMLQSGMEGGMRESMDQLDALVDQLAAS